MNTTLTALRQAMTDFLAGEGVSAGTAWRGVASEEGGAPGGVFFFGLLCLGWVVWVLWVVAVGVVW